MRWVGIVSVLVPAFLLASCGGSPAFSTPACSGCLFWFATTQSASVLSDRTSFNQGWRTPLTLRGPAGSIGIVADLQFPISFLYVSDPSADAIRVYQISVDDGSVSPANVGPYVLSSANGSLQRLWLRGSLLLADDSAGQIFAFIVNPGGSLTPVPGSPFATAAGASDLCTSPVFLYVASSTGANGSLSGFSTASDGGLSSLPGAPLSLPSSPAGLLCGLNTLYVALPSQSAIAAFSVQADGALTPISGSPFAAGQGVSSMVQLGNTIYAENNGAQTISAYTVQIGGGLVPVGGSPFPAPGMSGELAVVKSQIFVPRGSGLLVFQPDSSTGGLTLVPGQFSQLDAAPLAVTALQFPVFDPAGAPR